jgi:hypothetical protein
VIRSATAASLPELDEEERSADDRLACMDSSSQPGAAAHAHGRYSQAGRDHRRLYDKGIGRLERACGGATRLCAKRPPSLPRPNPIGEAH